MWPRGPWLDYVLKLALLVIVVFRELGVEDWVNATHVEVRTDAASLFPEPKSTQGQTKCFCCSLFLEHERMLSGKRLFIIQ